MVGMAVFGRMEGRLMTQLELESELLATVSAVIHGRQNDIAKAFVRTWTEC